MIIGTGLAGYHLAKEFRKLDKTSPLILCTADDGRFYSKPMLSNALAKGATPEGLAMADAQRMAGQLDAEIRTGSAIDAIEPARREVLVNGQGLSYGALVLAVGARQIPLSVAGDGAGDVFTVNSLDDYTRFRRALDGVSRVAVIGPGLIGCEFANDLCLAGKDVVVVGPDAHPLGRLLPSRAGAALKEGLARAGVQWRLGVSVETIARRADGYTLTLSDGGELEADLVLSAIGLRPETRLAAGAGLRVGRGIAVDRLLRTSHPQVYALGDCAEVSGLVLPFVMPIMHCARALARTLSGEPTEVRYPPMPVLVKTSAHPVVVAPPQPQAEGAWYEEPAGDGVRALFRDAGGRLLGFALTGEAVNEKQRLTGELPPVLE